MEVIFGIIIIALFGIVISHHMSRVLFKVLTKIFITTNQISAKESVIWNVRNNDLKFSVLIKNVISIGERMSYVAVGIIFMASPNPSIFLLIGPPIANLISIPTLILLASGSRLIFRRLINP